MFPKWIEYILKYYSFYNFHSKSTAAIGGKLVRCLILSFHVGLSTCCTFNTFEMFAEVQSIMAHLDTLNLFSYYLSCALTYWLIIIESYAMQSVQSAFLQSFIRINEWFCSQAEMENRNYLFTTMSLPLIDVLVFAFAITLERTTNPVDKIIHFLFLDLLAHRMCFYLLYVKVIEFQLRKMATMLNKMQELTKYFDD